MFGDNRACVFWRMTSVVRLFICYHPSPFTQRGLIMYKSSIEEKLKKVATILLIIGIIASVISGVSLIGVSLDIGISIIIFGVLFSITIYFLLSGFAQLIFSVRNIEADLKTLVNNQNDEHPKDTVHSDNLSTPTRCTSCGKINDADAKFCVICGKELLNNKQTAYDSKQPQNKE